jgi:hypothetical protein
LKRKRKKIFLLLVIQSLVLLDLQNKSKMRFLLKKKQRKKSLLLKKYQKKTAL